MDNQWYVRIRGQILGPFSVEKLQEMGKRGEFSRAHEVSQDGLSWERASAHPEFFPVVPVPKPTPPAAQAASAAPASSAVVASPASAVGSNPPVLVPSAPAAASAPSAPLAPSPQPQPPALWYYIRDGRPVGPISETELRHLLDTGQLSPNTFVWSERLPAWCPAKDAFEHLGKPFSPPQASPQESSAGELPDYICQTALRIRAWTMFLTVMYALAAFWLLITGITMIAVGSQKLLGAPLALGGVGSLIQAIVWGIYTFTMYNYTSSLKTLPFNRTMLALQKSMNELYNYFLVKGIVYIVSLIAIAIFGVVILIILIAYGQEAFSGMSFSQSSIDFVV